MIREAGLRDAEPIARLELRAWWRSHSEWLDPGTFDDPEQRIQRWTAYLAAPPVERRTLVFEVDGRVAGVASFGQPREQPGQAREQPATGELLTVSVDPPAQGAGVGGALLAAVERGLREDGRTEAVLWVFAANEHARHVYEQHGWQLDPGSERDGPGAREVRYRRAL